MIENILVDVLRNLVTHWEVNRTPWEPFKNLMRTLWEHKVPKKTHLEINI